MRNKKLARLGGSPFSDGRVPPSRANSFFPYKHFGSPNRVNSVKVTELQSMRERCWLGQRSQLCSDINAC